MREGDVMWQVAALLGLRFPSGDVRRGRGGRTRLDGENVNYNVANT